MNDAGACVIDGCAIPGRHVDGCPDGCGGCLAGRRHVGYLCRFHHGRLTQALAEMAGLWDELAEMLQPLTSPRIVLSPDSVRSGYSGAFPKGAHPGKGFDNPLPINSDVSDHREQIRHDLAWWSRLVADEREVHQPQPTVNACATFLTTHADWISAQPWVDEILPVMVELRGDALRLINPDGKRRLTLEDQCVEDGCSGVLVVTFEAEGAPLDRPSLIRCRDCNTEWPADRWLALARRIHRQEDVA